MKRDVRKVPTYDALMWPTLQAMKALGGSASNDELLEKVIELEHIPESVQTVMHSEGQTKLSNNLAWAKTYLGKYGALENPAPRIWAITAKGKRLKAADLARIPAAVRQLYRRKAQQDGHDDNALVGDPDTKDWKAELLSVVLKLPPDAFERIAQRVLRESGFVKVEVTGRSGDGGIDGVGVLRLSLLSFQVYFQCKRYKGSVSCSAIRDFRGAMVGRTDKGLFITTGTFTSEAKKEATRDGAPPIDLIDGTQLCDLLKQLRLGVTTTNVEHVTLEKDWFSTV